METKDAIAGAVRAEMARARKKSSDLAVALGLSRVTVGGRLSGAYPFTIPELDKVAEFLGLTTQDIMLSAALTERFGTDRTDEIAPLKHPKPDAWAQPPSALAKRTR
ncbi:helix-turn-helix domain-containing protein [Microbacterium sp. NPDC089696]|uniref:helix-turn-helix domain-containing protein n=1 Tax=Microbacterium sp. NPDC089696 TaxID=3364199 RepID=UPI0038067CDB